MAIEELWVAEDPLEAVRKGRFHKSKITISISIIMEKTRDSLNVL